jgi:lysine N6-hydroxylase
VDFVGVGIGPANLSLAALSQPVPHLTSRFYDRSEEFAWHPGLLFPESLIQTSYLKDLVTPVDPTNPYSFLSFLNAHKRFYSFVTASFPHVSRAEFGQYLAWVSRSLPNLEFDCPVVEIDFKHDLWHVLTPKGLVRARDIVLGSGLSPNVPEFARPFQCRSLHHASRFCHYLPEIGDRRVAVVGGGQSGAELVYHFLTDGKALPAKLLWISRRENFHPLDDSPFANEIFTPEYSEHFYRLDAEEKLRLTREQTLASDGISMNLLAALYRRLYTLRFVEGLGTRSIHLLPGHELAGLGKSDGGWSLEIRGPRGDRFGDQVDVVVLATGHRYHVPDYLNPLRNRIALSGEELRIREDYSVVWDGPDDRRIFVQNVARRQRGVADPNLSLLAWRSAVILNRLAGRVVYDCAPAESIIDWAEYASGESANRYSESRSSA